MNIIQKLIESVRDGSLPFRICNRFSQTKYAPITELNTNQLIARRYPDDGWKNLTHEARVAWNHFHSALSAKKPRNVVWVGANDGRGAVCMNEAFPGMDFFLLEPVRKTFQAMEKRLTGLPNLRAFNLAAGASEGELEMFVDEYSPASSLLPYDQLIAKDYPFLGKQSKETVRVRPLDTLLGEWKLDRIDFLIVDVQGYEDIVLAGAQRVLKNAQIVMVEMNLKSLYVGSATFDSVYQTLRANGLTLRHIPHFHRNADNEVVQIDGLFCRE